jgi:uncharacterized protein YceH (UPF0502 family)
MEQLSPLETRILGSLLEKERTTPEGYPLTLNSLVNACNQLSNRDPVAEYEERVVLHGLDLLRQKKLVFEVRAAGSRVEKYRHALLDHFQLKPDEVAILCVLMLRGPQTSGELRTRTERQHSFFSLEAAEASIQALMQRPEPLVRSVPPAHGQKENRYRELLSIQTETQPEAPPEKKTTILVDETRLSGVESELQTLRQELSALKEEFNTFKKQFES